MKTMTHKIIECFKCKAKFEIVGQVDGLEILGKCTKCYKEN